MSLDIWLTATVPSVVFSGNITHNLTDMADEAGIYEHIWRPDELGVSKAGDLVEPLKKGLELLHSEPERFMKLNSPNGWGTYHDFVDFVEDYIAACEKYPDAEIGLWR